VSIDELRRRFADLPLLIRRKHIAAALTPLLGSVTKTFVADLTTGDDFPRPVRFNHKVLLCDRDKVVAALAARLCEPAAEGGAA